MNEDIYCVTVLVQGTPETVVPPANRDEDFVYIPDVAELPLALFHRPSIRKSELAAPLPDGFVRDGDLAFYQQVLYVPETQSEAVIVP